MLHVTEACDAATGRRHLMAAAADRPVIAPNPNPSSTSFQVEVAFNERSNRVVGSNVMGTYAHFVHEREYTTSCINQVLAGANDKAAIEPRPQWRTTWMPELLDTVQLDITSTKTCVAPALSSSADDFFYSRLDVGVMNSDGSQIEFSKGSCIVALSMMYNSDRGCGCHCFEGQATVSFSETRSGKREVLSCSGLHREPELGCTCTMCPTAVA